MGTGGKQCSSADQADQAGQEIGQCSCDDRRNLEHLARQSAARLSVDFIAAHVLPYWENFTDKQAVDQAVAIVTSCCATSSPASGS